MKTLITLVTLVAAFTVIAPRNAWAAAPDSLSGFVQAPAVRKFHDAWAKCGPSGDSCPDKKSVAEVTRLRKEAIEDCLKSFVDNSPEKVGPCKVAVGAAPETFSAKVVEPVRQPKPRQPKPQPEPENPPEVATEPPEEVQPEPVRPPKPPVASVRPTEPDTETRAMPVVAPPKPPAPSNGIPGWLLFISWWNIGVSILSLGAILFFVRKKTNKPVEAPPAENAKVRTLREKSVVFQCQIELEEQIEPEGVRVETLKTLKERNDTTLAELLANLDKKLPQ